MKRLLFYLLALAPLTTFATLPPTGYYRVQNVQTGYYMSIVDNKTSSSSSDVANGNVDLEAILMLNSFEGQVAFNPATICYIEAVGSQYNISGQGLNLYNLAGRYFNIKEVGTGYQIYAQVKSSLANVSRYLVHGTTRYGADSYPCVSGNNRNWNILAVDPENSNQYFGVKPDVTANVDGSYWATMYAGFPFKVIASDMKAYVVCKIDEANGYAVVKEVDNVPAQTPILFRCSSSTPSGNRLTLLSPSNEKYTGTNYLIGNYYCNDVNDAGALYPHRHVTAYNASRMRMLGTTSDGKPAFVKGNSSNLVLSAVDNGLYLPANKCYLTVSSSAPDVLQIVTEAEYEEITGIEEMFSDVTEGAKVIYDLQGRRVAAPSKGVYIVNGKKVIVK